MPEHEQIKPGEAETLPERVAAVVAANTAPPQPDSAAESTIVRILTRKNRTGGRYDSGRTETVVSGDDVRNAIATAIDEGLIEPTDDGRIRYRVVPHD